MTNLLIIDILKTLIGFFLALLLNRLVDIFWRDPKQQKKILLAIKLEALTNCNVCIESFLEFYEKGIVLNQYSMDTIQKNISDPTFIINTDSKQLNILIHYLRYIKLCNKYPEIVRNLRLTHKKNENEWLEPTIEFWKNQIDKSALSIIAVLELSKNKDSEFIELLRNDKISNRNYSELQKKYK